MFDILHRSTDHNSQSVCLTHSWKFERVVDNVEEDHVNEISLSENIEAKLTRNLGLR